MWIDYDQLQSLSASFGKEYYPQLFTKYSAKSYCCLVVSTPRTGEVWNSLSKIDGKNYNITLNQKHKRLFANDGIRIGTQEIARYNWNSSNIKMLARLLKAIKTHNDKDIRFYRNQLISLKIPHFTFEDIVIE